MLKVRKAILFTILGNVVFGLSFLTSKIALWMVNPMLLLAIRFTVAFAILNILLLLGAFEARFKRKSLGVLIPMSICRSVVYFLCKNYGPQYATSSFSGPMIAMIPAVIFLPTTIILREPFRMSKFIWALCSVAGVCVISITGGGDDGVDVRGVLFLTGAAVSGSLYAVPSRKCSYTFTATERTYAMFAAGYTSFLAIAFIREDGNLVPACIQACKTPEFVGAVLYLVMVSPIVVFFSINYTAAYLLATQTNSFANLAVLVSIVAGVVFLGETSGAKEVVGAVLILCGVPMLNRADDKTAVV